MALMRIKRPRLRVDQRGHLMGFLYVDGHVRAYHGQRTIASKAYVARRHLAMPASIDYWINDRSGDPLLVITGEVNAALTKALPRLLREVRDLVGERRVTIVFDRGGWSPKLFSTMIKDGFDLLARAGVVASIARLHPPARRARRALGGLPSARPARGLAQGQAAPTASHAPVRHRPSDAGDHQSMGPARHRGRRPHVRALAPGELLQVHARRVPARCARQI